MMKTTQLSLLLMIIFTGLIISGTDGFSQQNTGQLFEKALYLEEAKGELQGAIDIYNQIVDDKSSDPAIQAKALLHMGICYEKLGMKEATRAYQRLVSNFSSHKNEVAVAKERLIKLSSSPSTVDVVIKQVWTDRLLDNSGSVSSDGVYLSFTNWLTGNLEIRNLQTGENRPLTSEGSMKKPPEQWAEASLITNDAKQVAYLWYYDKGEKGFYELRLVHTGDQTPVTLHYCGKDESFLKPESWFSNNKKIIYQTYAGKKTKTDKNEWLLSSIDITNKEVQLLVKRTTQPPLNSESIPKISISPDEKFLAYDFPVSQDQGMYDIYMVSIDSQTEIPIIKHPANDRLIGWLPGRNELIFTSDRSGKTDIWAVNTFEEKISADPKLILADIGDIKPMSLALKGTFFYSTTSRIVESFIAPFDSENGRIYDNQRITISGIADVNWLPDGEAFTCRPTMVGDQNLIVYSTKSKERTILAKNIILTIGWPRISPDGKSVLAFGRDKQKSKDDHSYWGIYSIDIKTGTPVEINVEQAADKSYPEIYIHSVEWDEDGKNIFYVHDQQIIKHNIQTGAEKIIYTDTNEFFIPVLRRSFDGRHLIFDGGLNPEENITNLLIIPVDGGEVRTLCRYNLGNRTFIGKQICLSPDGKYIYFSETGPAPEFRSYVSRIAAVGGTPQKVWEGNDYIIAGLSIHPDGKQIALSIFRRATEIRVAENLGNKVVEIFSYDK